MSKNRSATGRLFEYTGLIVVLSVLYVAAQTVGGVGVTKIGSWYEGKMYPVLAPMVVQQNDAEGNVQFVELPAFSVQETEWKDDGLLLVKGTLCKAQPYDFIRVNVGFGDPGGEFDAGKLRPSQHYGTRAVGCQEWNGWLLEGAEKTTKSGWFLEITSRPAHDRWNVNQILGPFDFPPKPDKVD